MRRAGFQGRGPCRAVPSKFPWPEESRPKRSLRNWPISSTSSPSRRGRAVSRTRIPAADFSVTYRLQPVVKVGGSEQRLAACTAQYVVGPRQFGPPQDFKRPDIPGFDGVPLDMPRPEKLAGGEYRITGAATRVEEQPPPVTLTFPQPQKQSKPLAVAKRTEQGWQITELPVVTEVSDKVTSRQSLHMIFSPDGKWLFVVDAENVLHKIGTEDLVEQATLKVGGACGDLCVSQAGLLAAARDAGQLWIIDPDSLAVRRAIALPGAMRVACSPRGNLALAVYRVPLLPPESQLVRLRTELGLIDLESGRILHRIRQFYGDRPLTLAGHPLFGSLQEWSYVRNQAYNLDPPTPSIAATGDGKHFFVGTGQIWRFRVDGNDLIYEEGAFENRSPLGVVTCVLSADDRFALLRGELVRGGIVVDPLRLSDVKCEMKDVGQYYCEEPGIDGKRGCFYYGYSSSTGGCNLEIFDLRGRKIAELRGADRTPSSLPPKIAVNPQGGEFVMSLSRDRLGYYRSPPGTLPEDASAVSNPPDMRPKK